MQKHVLWILTLTLLGCASPQSKVSVLGGDRYITHGSISNDRAAFAKMKEELLYRAKLYCDDKEKSVVIDQFRTKDGGGLTNARDIELVFGCE